VPGLHGRQLALLYHTVADSYIVSAKQPKSHYARCARQASIKERPRNGIPTATLPQRPGLQNHHDSIKTAELCFNSGIHSYACSLVHSELSWWARVAAIMVQTQCPLQAVKQ
jgi:hypothetical protein